MAQRSSFVNRAAEMAALAAEADRAARGEPRVVDVSGPAGIGKTALVGTFLRDQSPQATVLVAGAEAEAGVHLGAARALVDALAGRARHAGRLAEPAGLAMAEAEDPLACGAAILEGLGLAHDQNSTVQSAGPAGAVRRPVRRLIAAAAVLGPESRLADTARLAAVADPLDAAAAAPPDLVKLDGSPQGPVLRFTHPLNRGRRLPRPATRQARPAARPGGGAHDRPSRAVAPGARRRPADQEGTP
jgi:hypothetical protein